MTFYYAQGPLPGNEVTVQAAAVLVVMVIIITIVIIISSITTYLY